MLLKALVTSIVNGNRNGSKYLKKSFTFLREKLVNTLRKSTTRRKWKALTVEWNSGRRYDWFENKRKKMEEFRRAMSHDNRNTD